MHMACNWLVSLGFPVHPILRHPQRKQIPPFERGQRIQAVVARKLHMAGLSLFEGRFPFGAAYDTQRQPSDNEEEYGMMSLSSCFGIGVAVPIAVLVTVAVALFAVVAAVAVIAVVIVVMVLVVCRFL